MFESLLILLVVATASAVEAADATQPPAYEEFLIIPLRVHVLSATDLREVECGLKDEDITRIVGKVNGIWQMAGIHFGLESIVREVAAEQERFRLMRDVTGVAELGSYAMLAPAESRDFAGLHVYYVHKLPVNGVHFGDNVAFVQEIASLRPVEGGIDEPLPRVTAHELGHALSLQHRQDNINLMASGTTGALLNEDEVTQVRDAARKLVGFQSIADLRKSAIDAEMHEDVPAAKRFWKWLAEVPGDGAEEARQHVVSE